jgi:hypothetical protein
MKALALADKVVERQPEPAKQAEKYHSVEFLIHGLDAIYQFKLWEIQPSLLGIIVREDSSILPWLKAGERFNGKYYSGGSAYPTAMETQIQDINKIEQGLFKGHYVAGLKILGNWTL